MNAEPLNGAREAAKDLLDRNGADDPHDLADELIEALTRPQRRALLVHAAAELLREANRWTRLKSSPVGRSWKAGVGTADLLAQRFSVEGQWLTLGACNRDQVLAIASDYRDRAKRNLAHAEAMETLAADMARAGAATVADLFAAERAA